MDYDELKKDIDEMNAEINSWQLSDFNHEKFIFLMKILYDVKEKFNIDIVHNRYFCPICAIKLLSQKSVDAIPIITYLKSIKNLSNTESDFCYIFEEFLFTIYICIMINQAKPDFIIEHLQDYIKARHPEIKHEDDKEKVLSLKITSLAINAILSELTTKLLDFVIPYVYSMKLKEEVERQVIQFVMERMFSTVHRYTICFSDNNNVWNINFYKFDEIIFQDLNHCDPLNIVKLYKQQENL